MQTEVISIDQAGAIERALTVLQGGGLVAFPTDTVYGVAAVVHDPAGIERLYEAKGRDAGKAIAVLIGDVDQLEMVALEFSGPAKRLAAHFWPGALTLVVARHPSLPENLSALPTIGVRMPNHAFARTLLKAAGPLATTSANLSGQPGSGTAEEVFRQLGGRIELLLDGGATPGGVPSTVVDCTGLQPVILRHGAIPVEQIEQVIGG